MSNNSKEFNAKEIVVSNAILFYTTKKLLVFLSKQNEMKTNLFKEINSNIGMTSSTETSLTHMASGQNITRENNTGRSNPFDKISRIKCPGYSNRVQLTGDILS